MTTATEDPELEEAIDETNFEDEGDGDEPEGWIVVWTDGDIQTFPHPEGTPQDQVLKEYFEAAKKGNHFLLGKNVLATQLIRSFSWAADTDFPEFERFEDVQEHLQALSSLAGALAERQAELMQAQAALHDAQAKAYEVEGDLDSDDEEEELEPEPAPASAKKPGIKLSSGKLGGKKLSR